MAKKVFFSFDYRDVADFRANVVRQHWVTKPDRQISGYYDRSIWEAAETQGDIALKRLINAGLDGTSNICVLIGSRTHLRPWLRYELLKSFKTEKHIFGVHINSIKGKDGNTKIKGANPLDYLGVSFSDTGITVTLWEVKEVRWGEYTHIDGSSAYRRNEPVAQKYRGKFFKLSEFYSVYDWVDDDGFTNFSTWVG